MQRNLKYLALMTLVITGAVSGFTTEGFAFLACVILFALMVGPSRLLLVVARLLLLFRLIFG